jgi:hypothetical protein
MKTAKPVLSIIFLLLASIVYAQDIKSNQELMSTIISDPEHYHYAIAEAESYDMAVQKAVDRLATQISTKVENEGTIIIHNDEHNGEISSSSHFSNVSKISSDVNLRGYHPLLIGEPTKKSNTYIVFVYISSERVSEIIEEMKQADTKAAEASRQAEIEAAREKERLLDNNVNFYYTQGLNSLSSLRIGNALKFFYSGYIISSGTQATIERDGKNQPADVVFIQLLDETLHNIAIICEVDDEDKLDNKTTIFKKQLAFYYRSDDNILKKLDGLDFKYNDGNKYVTGARVRNGISTAELRRDLNKIELSCVYATSNNELDPVVREALGSKTIQPLSLSSADKTIGCNLVRLPKIEYDGEIATFEEETDPIESVKEENNSRFDNLIDIMIDIEDAIRKKNYNSVKPYFTPNGFDCFNKLIRYGNASIIEAPFRYDFIDFGDLVICRSITMQFKFKNNKQFVEDVTFRFNRNDQIESLAFTLTDIAQHDIMDNEDWSRDSKITLLTFMEDYQTAYALRRIDYLEQIFSDDALIISGYKVLKKMDGDGIKYKSHVRLDTLSKSQYMAKLRRHFNNKEYINLNFTETDFTEASSLKDVFGIRLRQEYYSSNYSDMGYLFLLVDLREDVPVIHIRAWQEDKLPLKNLISLRNFRF